MTRLTRSVRRETAALVQGRPLMLEVVRLTIAVRQKGKRVGYSVPIEAIFHLGGRIAAREAAKEKAEKKKGGKR